MVCYRVPFAFGDSFKKNHDLISHFFVVTAEINYSKS